MPDCFFSVRFQLAALGVGHVVQVEMPLLLLDAGVEDHLEPHVSQFLAHHFRVVTVDGLAQLGTFFQQLPPDGGVGLDLIPGTAVLSPEDLHDGAKVIPVVFFFARKIYHTLCSCASLKSKKPLFSYIF